MGVTGTTFKNKEVPFKPRVTRGFMDLPAGAGNFGLHEACFFEFCTGSTSSPDITPGQTANVTLVNTQDVPLNTRCYLTRVSMAVQGSVSWSATSPTAGSLPSVSLQDGLGCPLVLAPFNAMRAGSMLDFSSSQTAIPLILGPSTVNGAVGTPATTFTYVASTGVLTAGAAVFVLNIGVGGVAKVIGGTGFGQTAIVSAVGSTTSCTFLPAFTGLDATSVIGIAYQSIKTATDTSHSTLYNSTNYTLNAFDNGFNVIGVLGTSTGSVRPISASSTVGALTYGYALNTNFDTTTSLIQVNNNTELNGAVDLCVGDVAPAASLNQGIYAVVNQYLGTTPVGSNVRIYGEGFFA